MNRHFRRRGLLPAMIVLSLAAPPGGRDAVAQFGGYRIEPPRVEERYHAFSNLLENGDFERDEDVDGFPDGWTAWRWVVEDRLELRKAILDYLDTTAGAITPPRLSTRYPFFGKRSVDLRSADGKTGPGVYTALEFDPGIYTLSLYAKNPGEGRRRLGLFMATGGRLFEVGKRWRNIVHSERVPFRVRAGEVSLRDWTFSPGDLLIDRVVLVRLPFDVRYPSRFDIDGEKARFVVDFTGVPEVSLPVGINLEIVSPGGETVRKNIEGVLESPEDQVVFEFDAAREGRYDIRVEIYDLRTADVIFADPDIVAARREADGPDGEEIGTAPDPASVDSASIRFFPVGIRARGHELEALAGRGFNCVLIVEPQADEFSIHESYLHDGDMKIFYEVDSETYGGEGGTCADALLDLLRSAAERPGFAGWFLRVRAPAEEPGAPVRDPVLRCIREEDPGHPVVLEGLLPGAEPPAGLAAVGYVALDPNPVSIPARPLFLPGLWADRLAAVAGSDVRTIGMPQIFGGWPVAHRIPTFTEIRAMTYLSVVHGARGIIYRDFSSLRPFFDRADPAWDVRKAPEIWDRLPELNAELLGLSSWFLRTREAPGGIVAEESESIDHALWVDGGTAILVAVNVYDGEVEAHFSLERDRFDDEVEALFEERTLRVDGGVLSDRFGPFETHVYRLRGSQ